MSPPRLSLISTNLARLGLYVPRSSRCRRIARSDPALRDPVAPAAAALALCLALSACHNENIAVYSIPKENNQVSMENATGDLAPPPPTNPAKWKKPDAWEEKPLTEMRLASFAVHGPNGESADVSVTAFPGDAGGLESNVNRWREQVHQPALDADQLGQSLERETVDGVPTMLVDVQSPPNAEKPGRILGAIFHTADRSWFVKMTGPTELLESQRENFSQFVKSFRFSSSSESNEEGTPPSKTKSTNDR